MGDTEQASTAADPPGPGEDASTDQRLDHLENAVERIEQALTRLVPGSRAEAQQRTEQRLDRSSSVAEQVQAELKRVESEKQAAAAAEGEQSERKQVQERLARLEEQPPAPPRLRRTALLGWGDGRG
jgi:hypothetical protein